MKPLSLEAAIFYCAKQLADEEEISEEVLYELYVILSLYFENIEKVTLH